MIFYVSSLQLYVSVQKLRSTNKYFYPTVCWQLVAQRVVYIKPQMNQDDYLRVCNPGYCSKDAPPVYIVFKNGGTWGGHEMNSK